MTLADLLKASMVITRTSMASERANWQTWERLVASYSAWRRTVLP